jgi:LacI family transcriptional regulator
MTGEIAPTLAPESRQPRSAVLHEPVSLDQTMTVTITDIARRVGVSHPVVSKVLHGGKSNVGVSVALRSRIMQVATELDYRPNAASRALRSQRFGAVGILMGGSEDNVHLPQATLSSLTRTLSAHDQTCALVCATLDPQKLTATPLLRSRRLDVLIVSYTVAVPDDLREALHRLGLPLVWMHNLAPSDSVALDERDACEQLVHHLADLGHKRLLFVDYSSTLEAPSTRLRLTGLENACHSRNIDPSMMVTRRVPRAERFEATKHWLTRRNRPRAVIANSMHNAEAILQTALHLGLRVPQDLSIATFDDGTAHDVCIPAMTAVLAPQSALGQAAADMALLKAASPSKPLGNRLLKFTLSVGASTARPGSASAANTVRVIDSSSASTTLVHSLSTEEDRP